MITAFQSALGTGFDELPGGKKRTIDGSLKLKVNYKGHTFTNRFVITAIPKAFYESKPQVFQVATHHLGKGFEQLLTDGLKGKGASETYRVCVISCKGDIPYLQKMGGMLRAFNTGAKRGKEEHQARGICYLSLAGQENYPSEKLSTSTPRWLITMGVEDPWHILSSMGKSFVSLMINLPEKRGLFSVRTIAVFVRNTRSNRMYQKSRPF